MGLDMYCITEEYTLIDAIDAIKASKNRGVIVVGNNNKVIGFVSQGDILNAVVNGVALYSQVSNLINTSFIYLYEKDYKKAAELFKKKCITILPIVDQKFILKDIITLKEIIEHMELKED